MAKMAKYENLGYCPYNAFCKVNIYRKAPEKWSETKMFFGDRTAFMVYLDDSHRHGKDHPYVVDALAYTHSELGLEVAKTLSEMIPECKYPDVGRPIVCKDIHIRPQITEILLSVPDRWYKCISDDRYFVIICDTGVDVKLYFYKK